MPTFDRVVKRVIVPPDQFHRLSCSRPAVHEHPLLADTGFSRPAPEADHGRPCPRVESQLTGSTSYLRSRPIAGAPERRQYGDARRAGSLKRIFEIELKRFPNDGGELTIKAAACEQPVIEKTLTHLGLQARAPPRAPARGSQPQAA